MPMQFQMDDQQMEITKRMMESMWGIEFKREPKDNLGVDEANIVARYADPKGRTWIALCSDGNLNSAQINNAQQILEWMAARNMV